MTEPAKPISDEGGRPLLPWERAARQAQPSPAPDSAEPPSRGGLRPPTGGKEPSGETHQSFQGIKSRIHRRLL
jgi:hypothetical protein